MISKEQDEFIILKLDREARWIVKFDGFDVFQDDNRYGEKDPAWLRLVKYGKENNLYPRGMTIEFRDNRINLDREVQESDGLYFTLGAGKDASQYATDNYFVVGFLRGDTLTKVWYKTPEMQRMFEQTESLEEVLNGEFVECLLRR